MFKRTLLLMKAEMTKQTQINQLTALNVAEKPSVARTISDILSKKSAVRLDSFSMYNPVFQFKYQNPTKNYLMNFTSVVGHLMNFKFVDQENKIWKIETTKSLYHTKIAKEIKDGNLNIAKNLKHFAKDSDVLILWLDCDREGENIAYEVIEVVKKVNPKIQIFRAKFSALTEKDIIYSIDNLEEPDKNLADAVDLRQKIDLLIGASFTRLQTLSFQNILSVLDRKLNKNLLISYGPCQFPTLNFIVERADKIQNFKKENFHFLELTLTKSDPNNSENSISTSFNWERERLFDIEIVTTLEEKLNSNPNVEIIEVISNTKNRLKPFPLNTVEMQKLISRKLKISSHIVMDVVEKLYQKGFISYPRTETQKYSPNEIPNLKRIAVEISKGKGYTWCEYAKNLLDEKNFYKPREGKSDDKAHPPIHPVKFVEPRSLTDLERNIYETICVHFLATLSQDAKGDETVIKAIINEEKFIAKGLRITRRGYLDVYPYDSWNDVDIAEFSVGEKFILNKNAILLLKQGNTTPPNHLTESELISLMDKHGIGTDSTIHEHIKNVKERGYTYQKGSFLKPSILGNALIQAYKKIGVELNKPYLRAAMERDMKNVCEGKENAEKVYQKMKNEMEKIFETVYEKIPLMQKCLEDFLKSNNSKYSEKQIKSIGSSYADGEKKNLSENLKIDSTNYERVDEIKIPVKCPVCGENELRIIENRKTNKYFMGCCGYPKCKNTMSINNPSAVYKSQNKCEKCSSPLYELEYEGKKNKTQCLEACFLSGNESEIVNKNKHDEKSSKYMKVKSKRKSDGQSSKHSIDDSKNNNGKKSNEFLKDEAKNKIISNKENNKDKKKNSSLSRKKVKNSPDNTNEKNDGFLV